MSLFTKLFGTYSDHQLKRLEPTVRAVEALAEQYESMSEEELRGTTERLRGRLAAGETLDDILPDAFAAVREADWRVLGKRPFRVQIVGGILLHQGRIAEMKTGEGKTLVATMPAYLNALAGEGVHIVTVNDYLARRDSEEMGRVYGYLGLTTGLVVQRQPFSEKKEAYLADITYGTNDEFGFDYLRDNMQVYKRQQVQRGHAFAIVDEVDSILVDEARTPLIISGMAEEATEMYKRANDFVRKLKVQVRRELDDKDDQENVDADYIVDEKGHHATLTPRGVQKAERFFQLENYSDPQNADVVHHVNQAIHAHGCKKRDVDYIVNQKGVIIVDSFTGRLMPGRRYSNGLHQAIEAKEGVEIRRENRTQATITYQNYFRMYRKLSGMTGTALTEENEFREIYGLDVVEVPTNRPMIRIDRSDVMYKSVAGKYAGILRQIKECHAKGQPILVGTVDIEKSEALSLLLQKEGIPHKVLNAKYHEEEAEIVAQAGRLGAVTIATNMAGRGTDIMLGGNPEHMAKVELREMGVDEALIALSTGTAESDDPEVNEVRATFRSLYEKYREQIAPEAQKVREAGGLFILGTERHESRRIDNQLRGRSGRQGDPGESRFYLSLEDDLMRLHGGERVQRAISVISNMGMRDDMPLDQSILSSAIEMAQRRMEDQNFNRRKSVLAYDDVMNQQRSIIYKQRGEVLDNRDVSETISKMIARTIHETVAQHTLADTSDDWDIEGLRAAYMGVLIQAEDEELSEEAMRDMGREDLTELLTERARQRYQAQEEAFGAEIFREVERALMLNAVDRAWMAHIDAMEDLKSGIGLQSYAQRDPVTEYRVQSCDIFDSMISDIRANTVRAILTADAHIEVRRTQVAKPLVAGHGGAKSAGTRVTLNNARANTGAQMMRGAQQRTTPLVADMKSLRESEQPSGADAEPYVARKSLCPCGSGKKYKHCCGKNAPRGNPNG